MRPLRLILTAAVLLAFIVGLSWTAHQIDAKAGTLAAVFSVFAMLQAPALLEALTGKLGQFGLRSLTQLLPSFNNVAVSSTATTRLPRNRRYHAIFLQFKTNDTQANIQSALTEIRIKVNSKVVRTFSATQLYLINALNGRAFTAGMLPIFFSEPWRRTPEGEEFLALNAFEALGVGDVDIEVDISAAIAAPTLAGIMVFDYERPANVWADIPGAVPGATPAQAQNARLLRTVMHWQRKITPCAAAFTASSPLTPANFFPALDGFLHRVHSFDAVITANTLRNGETPFWTSTDVQLPQLLIAGGMTKQASTFHLVLDATQQYTDGLYLPSVPNTALDFVASGAATGNQFASILEIRKPLDA